MADMQDYLRATEIIDWKNLAVLQKAKELAGDFTDTVEITRCYFEWVRDEIMHSNDHKMNPVTLKASEVLKYGTGYCYAKSHLLAALLRANSIPCGICY